MSMNQCRFSPLTVRALDNGYAVAMTGREYTVQNGLLFSSMISQGQQILSSPMRVVSCENGAPSVWRNPSVLLMDDANENRVTIVSAMESDFFFLNSALTIEKDGCVRMQIKIMPRGWTVKQVFFGPGDHKQAYHLDSLQLEIPIRKEIARFYQMYPSAAVRYEDGSTKPNGALSTGDAVHNGETYFPFCHQLFFTNGTAGIGCFTESIASQQHDDPTRVIECIDQGDTILLRYRLLDSHPRRWKEVQPSRDVSYFRPITFDFGLMVTPFARYPQNPYEEHAVHIDCFKKLDENYEVFLPKSFIKDDGTDTGESAYDRMKRLGVNTIYLHEKWNDLQNSVLITRSSAKRLKTIVAECHARSIRVIPYFGYEISSLSPEYSDRITQVGSNRTDGEVQGMWSRVPSQRDGTVCPASDWSKTYADGIAKLMDEFHFDGVYLDGTCTPWACANEAHGCGVRDEDGTLHPTHPAWACRRLMQAISEVVWARGGTINCHTSASFPLGALPYADSIWEGEVAQFALIRGAIDRMPEGIYRSQFSGRAFGIPLFMLCYANPPIWTYSAATAFSLLVGTIPKPNDLDIPLEITSRIWEILDRFPIQQSTWVPYYDVQTDFQTSDDAVKVSYFLYRNPIGEASYLVFAANTRKIEAKEYTLTAPVGSKIYDLLTDRNFSDAKTEPETLEGFGYRIYFVR